MQVEIKCLRRRLTRSRDIGTAVLSFLGTITGKLSSSATALRWCRPCDFPLIPPETSAAPAMIKISMRIPGRVKLLNPVRQEVPLHYRRAWWLGKRLVDAAAAQ
jgi:hypothetical protein